MIFATTMDENMAKEFPKTGCLQPCPVRKVANCRRGSGRSWQTSSKESSLAYSRKFDLPNDKERHVVRFRTLIWYATIRQGFNAS
jgi:hypothetical protein